MKYHEAIAQSMNDLLDSNPKALIFGVDVGRGKHVYSTLELAHKRHSDRVFPTPICENSLTGMALGLSLAGYYPVLVHLRADFALSSMDQLVNHVAIWEKTFGAPTPLCIRIIVDLHGWGQSPQHSKDIYNAIEPWFPPEQIFRFLESPRQIIDGYKAIFAMKKPCFAFEYRHLWEYEYA